MERGKARKPFSHFTARGSRPAAAEIRATLGRAAGAWDDLEGMLRGECHLRAKTHYMYGAPYGWALRFERAGRLVAALYPNRGRLFLQLILNRAQVSAAQGQRLPAHVGAALRAARPYPKERWLFIPVRSRKDARDVRGIVSLKLSRPEIARAGPPRPSQF